MAAANADTLPDFYGPFLETEQIAFLPDESNPDPPELLLGDFTLQVVGGEVIRPNHHRRFILNALLSDPEGTLPSRDFYEAGFHADAKTPESRGVSFTNNLKGLMESLTADGVSVIEKKREQTRIVINLASDLQIVRVEEDSLDFVPKSRKPVGSVPDNLGAPPKRNPTKFRTGSAGVPPQRSLSVGEAEAREKLEMADRIKSYIAVGGAYPYRPMAFGTIVERKRAVRQAFADAHGDPDAEARLAELSRDLAAEENRLLDLSHENVSGYTSGFFEGAKPRRR